MSITPEFGEEERMRQQEQQVRRQAEGGGGADRDEGEEREIEERDEGEKLSEYLQAEDNEAHAPGQVCARCGAVITAVQDVRRLPDGHWVHEACPPPV